MTKPKLGHIISIVYVILLTLGPLFTIVWIYVAPTIPIEPTSSDPYGNASVDAALLYGPILLYIIACFVLGIIDSVRSFKAFKAGQEDFCLTSMLIHKYGLIAFFILNFILCVLIITGSALVFIGATRGAGIVFSPLFFNMGLIAAFLSYLAILPGSFYGTQVARFTRLRGLTTTTMSVFHIIFQLLFLADVIDAMYLSAAKWGKGKKLAIVVGIASVTSFVAIVGLLINGMAQLFAA